MKVIASIEEPDVIADAAVVRHTPAVQILKHLGLDEYSTAHNRSPPNQTGADIFALC